MDWWNRRLINDNCVLVTDVLIKRKSRVVNSVAFTRNIGEKGQNWVVFLLYHTWKFHFLPFNASQCNFVLSAAQKIQKFERCGLALE
jgi:hypothetical protein